MSFLMLAPAASRTFLATSGNVYASDANSLIFNVMTVADAADLAKAGCQPIQPLQTNLLGCLKSANFNSTADQGVPLFTTGARLRVTRIVVENTSVNGMSGAAGGFYTGAGKTGTVLVAAGQVYTGMTDGNTAIELTMNAPSAVLAAGTGVNFSLSSGHGGTATADIYLFGDIYN